MNVTQHAAPAVPWGLIGVAIAGLAATWFFNPSRGGPRARAARVRYRVAGRSVDDDTLVRRVGSVLGHHVSDARPLGVTAEEGKVVLSGPVPEDEIAGLLAAVEKVPGVKGLTSELRPVPPGPRRERRSAERDWRAIAHKDGRPAARKDPTAAQLAAGVVGSLLVAQSLRKPRPLGLSLGGVGAVLVGTGMGRIEPARLLSGLLTRTGVAVEKSLTIDVPVRRAFEFFSRFEEVPRYMRNVREVRSEGPGRARWIARGPAGVDVTWTSTTTRLEPERLIAWHSDTDSPISSEGAIQFFPLDDGRTRLRVWMTYAPPSGILGRAVASIFGPEPELEMEADLERAKVFLETGASSREGDEARSRELHA